MMPERSNAVSDRLLLRLPVPILAVSFKGLAGKLGSAQMILLAVLLGNRMGMRA